MNHHMPTRYMISWAVIMLSVIACATPAASPASVPSSPTPIPPTPTPVPPTLTPISLPTTNSPKCWTIVTIADKESLAFGETNIPFTFKEFYYQGIVIAPGVMEVSDGGLEEVAIEGRPLTLVSKDLKNGVHTEEFGGFKILANASMGSSCALLVATPEQIQKIFAWLK